VIRAHIHENYCGFSIDVSIVDHPPEGSLDIRPRILHLCGDPERPWLKTWDEIPADGSITQPTFSLGHEEIRPVLDALAAHFHGAEDTRALRRDYDSERQRVDKLTDTLSRLAGKLAETAPAPPVADPAVSAGGLRAYANALRNGEWTP
jgi:hypothetical protein